MKIIKMTSENVMKLKAVEIEPDGNVIIIEGKNGAGKTSILDSIYMALTGNVPSKPIRNGEDKAEISIKTDKYIITKTIKSKNGGGHNAYLKVESSDGASYKKPQAMLNDLLGHLTFDPLEFASMKSKERRELLLDLVGIDLNEIDNQREQVFNDRTYVGRELKSLKGQLDGAKNFPPDTVDNEVAVVELVRKQSELTRELNLSESIQREIEHKKDEYEKLMTRLDGIKNKINDLEDTLAEQKDAEMLRVDIDAIKDQIEASEEININVRRKREYQTITMQTEEKQLEYDNLTDEIKKIDLQKEDMIRASNMPIAGLGLDDNGVAYNGIPFDQLSSAEQLKISMAMAMAMNPEMRIIRITDGSLLDSNSMDVIEEMAKKQDYQVWIERVADNETGTGIYIEEGEIKP